MCRNATRVRTDLFYFGQRSVDDNPVNNICTLGLIPIVNIESEPTRVEDLGLPPNRLEHEPYNKYYFWTVATLMPGSGAGLIATLQG